MFVENSKSVFFWGFLNRDKVHSIPTIVHQLEGKNIEKVASGGLFNLAVTNEGQLYGWGCAKNNRYGVSNAQHIQIPIKVPIKFKVSQVTAGNWHSLALEVNTNHVFAVGHNKYGCCGVGNFINVEVFTPVLLNSAVTKISAGDGVSLMLTEQKNIYSCGHWPFHGHKTNQNINKPTKIVLSDIEYICAGFTHCICINKLGEVYQWGKCFKKDEKLPIKVKGIQGIKIVQGSCSRGEKNPHTMIVDQKGALYTWGSGYKGKLGHQEQWSHADSADQFVPRLVKCVEVVVKKSSAGGIHSNILSQDGQVLSFGCGSNGRLGHIQSMEHRYLYREGYPRVIEVFKNYSICQLESSYYHNICLGLKQVQKSSNNKQKQLQTVHKSLNMND